MVDPVVQAHLDLTQQSLTQEGGYSNVTAEQAAHFSSSMQTHKPVEVGNVVPMTQAQSTNIAPQKPIAADFEQQELVSGKNNVMGAAQKWLDEYHHDFKSLGESIQNKDELMSISRVMENYMTVAKTTNNVNMIAATLGALKTTLSQLLSMQ